MRNLHIEIINLHKLTIYSKFRAKMARVGTRALKNQKKLTIYSKTQVKLAHKRPRVPTRACDLIHN